MNLKPPPLFEVFWKREAAAGSQISILKSSRRREVVGLFSEFMPQCLFQSRLLA